MMEWFALILSGIAVTLSATAVWYVRDQVRATQLTARAARAAVELQHEIERRTARAAEAAYVLWDLEPVGEDTYLLRNEGSDPAYDVRIDVGDMACRGPVHIMEFPPGHVERYQLFRPLGTVTAALTVTWNQASDLTDEPRTHHLPVLDRGAVPVQRGRADSSGDTSGADRVAEPEAG
ncbi:hypothetical protein H0B56_13030 [Haloechinothrix sp. YIM 98757]|uniref:Uncharacterized protein n=1 Tax=Haloechinothrix aidingensis TaxID=2752311 RepID=A0A838AB65_9PSEU|nr:hypothetical protein [Haloechinothrix aidingensis]MBA0126467.1 hypothetical protein [Haloechinothrix aidingensis]